MRRYRDTRKHDWPLSQECEHCDGEHGPRVRNDELRGFVCPWCDDAYDAMEAEMAEPGDAYADEGPRCCAGAPSAGKGGR